ncbi:MAG: T9SS type A sorting domain-containing protein, partial [candidate division Zixibacteria bacterium]|nr:T9SS type A sorting domain-containing protein [candidate division Zixibacteria bacterium]
SGGYQLVVNPESFNYTVPMDHFFYDYLHIEELHGDTLFLNFSNTQPWLSLPMILVLPPTPMTLEFGISTDSLPPGTYNDVITIYGYADNSQPPVDVAHVPVWLTVTEGQPFVVHAAPDHFEFIVHQGAHVFTEYFLVYDEDSANLPFAVTTVNNSDWLVIDTSTMSGITPSHVIFHIGTAGLEPGTYGDSVLIYYPLDDMYGFDDVLVPVILHILSDTLDAIVATEPESFNFVVQQGEIDIDELYVYEIHGGTVPFMMWNQTSWLDFGFCLTMPLITPCTSPFVVNTDSLDPGNYYDTITIWPDTDGVSFPPVAVPVSLHVLPSGQTPNDSLIIPSISVLPCDWECVVQPVQTKLSQPIKGATIPISIPDGVEICSLSTSGLITEGWDWNFSEVNDSLGYVFMALANSYNAQIPVGVTNVFNIHFYVAPECRENLYFHWDTTLMLSFSKHLAYTDTTYTTVNPGFDMYRDSVEVRGYIPGSFDGEPQLDISDLVGVVDYMFTYGPPPCVINALDVNGDCMGPDISDLVALIDYMFMAWDPPPEFPPELSCGCITDDGSAVAKLNPDITISAVYQDGNTMLILSSPVDLRGLQLEVQTVGDPDVQKLVDDQLDLVHGESNGLMRVGILDLDGADVIAAGETPVVRLSGEVEIVNAVVTDGRYISMAAVVSGSGDELLPGGFSLGQNYPNPFNPKTTISFNLPQPSLVTLEVFNITGQKVATLVDGPRGAGEHTISWDAREMSSGVYFYKLTTPEHNASRKMVLLK